MTSVLADRRIPSIQPRINPARLRPHSVDAKRSRGNVRHARPAMALPCLLDDAQNYLAVLAPRGRAGKGSAGLSKREDRVNLRPQLLGFDEPAKLTQLLAVGLNDKVNGSRRLGRDSHDPVCPIGCACQCLTA